MIKEEKKRKVEESKKDKETVAEFTDSKIQIEP
jgi:hypothetical protein